MWQWARKILGLPKFDDDPGKVIEAGRVFSECVIAQLLPQFTRAGVVDRGSLSGEKMMFVCGYIAGFSDVMSQSINARAGGNLSQTVTVRVLHEVFGRQCGESLMHLTFEWMATDLPLFVEGMVTGGQDANQFLEHRNQFLQPRIPSGLSNYLTR